MEQTAVSTRIWLATMPMARCDKLRVVHTPGIPGMFSPPPRVSDPDMHHGMCVMHVPWCMPGSLTIGYVGGGGRSRHSRRMRNPQFYVSGIRPMWRHCDSRPIDVAGDGRVLGIPAVSSWRCCQLSWSVLYLSCWALRISSMCSVNGYPPDKIRSYRWVSARKT